MRCRGSHGHLRQHRPPIRRTARCDAAPLPPGRRRVGACLGYQHGAAHGAHRIEPHAGSFRTQPHASTAQAATLHDGGP
eukprot:186136-Chlamydomonas_euryale.AAC.4